MVFNKMVDIRNIYQAIGKQISSPVGTLLTRQQNFVLIILSLILLIQTPENIGSPLASHLANVSDTNTSMLGDFQPLVGANVQPTSMNSLEIKDTVAEQEAYEKEWQGGSDDVDEGDFKRWDISQWLNQLMHVSNPMTPQNEAEIIQRVLVCQELLQMVIQPNRSGGMEPHLSHGKLLPELIDDPAARKLLSLADPKLTCRSAQEKWFIDYYFDQFNNSTLKRVSEALNEINKMITLVNFTLIAGFALPIFSRLTRRSPSLAIWCLLKWYACFVLAYLLLATLPQLVHEVWHSLEQTIPSRSQQSQSADTILLRRGQTDKNKPSLAPEERSVSRELQQPDKTAQKTRRLIFGLDDINGITCPLVTFFTHVFRYTPHWLLLVALWEQIVRRLNSSGTKEPHPMERAVYQPRGKGETQAEEGQETLKNENQEESEEVRRKWKKGGLPQQTGFSSIHSNPNRSIHWSRRHASSSHEPSGQQRRDGSKITVHGERRPIRAAMRQPTSTDLKLTTPLPGQPVVVLTSLYCPYVGPGLGRLGAQLVTITAFVGHIVMNIHSLWLYTIVEDRCRLNSEHSYIFYSYYPIVLHVSGYFIKWFYNLYILLHHSILILHTNSGLLLNCY
ncbi:unnamed protein product [Protopolystoma xenopodis]|uniref:Chloride channel CLIC-like protein 1 n=1 Tax=Protopolystoma xenopodis TaxID=117903 RepID=A0A448WHR7_9PLAT|nr:unnamed protein product [Protopolystoma xenopodis]